MKQYMLLLSLIILITSCTPKGEVEKLSPPVETPAQEETQIQEQEPKEIIKEEPKEPTAEETNPEENIVEIREDSFYPKEKIIEENTEIKWIKKDPRIYKVACYLGGNRITLSPDLKEGDSFTYTFLEEGEYTCITFPYGLRNIIKVEAQKALLSPTGRAVMDKNANIEGAPLASIAVIAIIVLLFFVYGRKRQ